MKNLRFVLPAVLMAFLVAGATPAYADGVAFYSFHAITNNSGIAGGAAPDFILTVTDLGNGQVSFKFENMGTLGGPVITQIYWDDNASVLGSLITLAPNWGVPATPANLPSGNNVGFLADFSTDADNSQITNGVDGGEMATFILTLAGGATFNDLITAMNNGNTRVGIHVQRLNGTSDAFVSQVPEPSSLLLLGFGLLGAGVLSRRRK